MTSKRIINWLQNLLLVVLTVSAVCLLTRFPMLEGVVTGQMQALLTMPDRTVQQSVDITSAISTVHFVVTDENEYGRYAVMNADAAGADFQRLAPLFREAIGSATTGAPISDEEFRAVLEMPGIYVDLEASLPISVVAAWLGEEYDGNGSVRSLALISAQETAMLYLCDGQGVIFGCASALTSAAVREMTATFAPNGGRFAFESGYNSLAPYTVLTQEVPAMPDVHASVPGGYTAYNLLTALDFNAHTNYRYTESSGVEVVVQTPLTLRIGADGRVNYSADGDVTSDLYRVPCAGELPTAMEALKSACGIAAALTGGTDASALELSAMEQTEDGWIITFHYRAQGAIVRLAGDRDALRVVVSGDAVTQFDYCCRAYAPMERSAVLLPSSMAVAIAALYEDAQLTLAYVDNGAEVLSARWFAQ